jgi:glycosyltransferase involved in cell wall biosynthesis
MSRPPRVVIVHDYATQRGGAERVALDLLRAFPGSRLVTSCWDKDGTYPDFGDYEVQTLWTDRVSALRSDPRRAFPFLAKAFAQTTITDADVVICSSSGWSHRVSTTGAKIVYCHNPARWLYQPKDYFVGMSPWVRARFVDSSRSLRRSDAAAAHSADRYVVNSTAVAARVQGAYGIIPTLVPPARGLSPEGPQTPIPGIEPGFLLTISRPRSYKHTDAICDAVTSMPDQRLVVVGGLHTRAWPLGVTGLNKLSDSELRWLYANAAGLIAVANEDFGLTPVEAQSFGLPSLVLRSGGYLDSSVEGVTAVFVDDPGPAQLARGVRELLSVRWDADAIRRVGENYSPTTFARRMGAVVNGVLESTVPVRPAPVRTLHAVRSPQPVLATQAKIA